MRFYGSGLVWDPAAGKICARFTGGVFETEDAELIARLDAMGVKHDELPELFIPTATTGDAAEISVEGPTRKELIAQAKLRGITGADRKSKDELLELLGGGDNGESA